MIAPGTSADLLLAASQTGVSGIQLVKQIQGTCKAAITRKLKGQFDDEPENISSAVKTCVSNAA